MSAKLASLVWRHFPSESHAKIVLLAIAECTNSKTGECYPSVRTIGSMVGLKERRVQQLIRVLQNCDVLTVVGNYWGGQPGDTRHYKIIIKVLQKMNMTDAMQCTPKISE